MDLYCSVMDFHLDPIWLIRYFFYYYYTIYFTLLLYIIIIIIFSIISIFILNVDVLLNFFKKKATRLAIFLGTSFVP